MEINKDYSFTVNDENGMEVICDVLSVINIEGQDPIIIYTDYTLDNEQKFNLFVSKVIGTGEDFKLECIDDYSIIPEIQSEIIKISNQINMN